MTEAAVGFIMAIDGRGGQKERRQLANPSAYRKDNRFQALSATAFKTRLLPAIEIGIAKAKTAAITRKPTQWWMDQLHGGILAFLAMPGVTPVGGAHPIIIEGQVVGAVSTAGGSFDVDNDICQAALAIVDNG
jgi:Haem-degrading